MHPLKMFRHCPQCGAACFEEHDERSKRCGACGFTYYHNASAATVAVIFDSLGRLLVTRRAFDPAKGTLDLPGGFVDPGEGAEQGCLREVKEETGAEAVVEEFLFSQPNTYNYSNFVVHTTDLFFRCTLKDEAQLAAADDVADLFWLPLHEICPEQFGLHSIRKGIELLLQRYGQQRS